MALSFEKLRRILTKYRYQVISLYVYMDTVMFVQIVSVLSGNTYLLYVPSRYEMAPSAGETIYKISDLTDDVGDEFRPEPDDAAMNEMYGDVHVDRIFGGQDADADDVASSLNDNYRKRVYVTDAEKKKSVVAAELRRQLRRFRYAVEDLDYKLAIIQDDVMSRIDSNNDIEPFAISNGAVSTKRRIYAVIHLDTFVEKSGNVYSECDQIKAGVLKLVERNHDTHNASLNELIQSNADLIGKSQVIHEAKVKTRKYIEELELLLKKTNRNEESFQREIEKLVNRMNTTARSTADIQRKKQLEEKIKELQKTRNDVIVNLQKVRDSDHNMSLLLDGILFDNIVMMNTMFRNLKNMDRL